MHIQKENVTPAIAKAWLEKNTSNRPLMNGRVRQISAAITRGEWMLNGDTIRFSHDDVLLDGQHRLAAIVEADTAVETFVVRGLPTETFTTIDTGKARTASDIISLSGTKYATAVASISRAYLNWLNTGSPLNPTPEKRPTNQQLYDFVTNDDCVVDVAAFCYSLTTLRAMVPVTVSGFLYMAGMRRDKEKTIEFLTQLNNSTGPRHPSVDLLRDRLLLNKGSKKRMMQREVYAICIKALRFFIEDTDVKQLKIVTKGRKEKDLFRV